MIDAFIQAGLWALCSIAVLLWIVLRRAWDVMLTLLPLLVAAAATLEICALLHFPINYANIIALPVLLGVGVAFKIYYVLAWRQGETNFLQSPLTRRRRRLQDLLCAGVAARRDEFPAIAAYSASASPSRSIMCWRGDKARRISCNRRLLARFFSAHS
jgi:hypothetical protein